MSRVYYVSPAYERITGYSCETLYENPRAWTKLIDNDDRAFVLKRVADRLEGDIQGRTELEYRIHTAAGELRWLRVIQSPVRDESGQVDRLAGIAEDITARKQTETALREIHADLARQVELRTQELSQTVSRIRARNRTAPPDRSGTAAQRGPFPPAVRGEHYRRDVQRHLWQRHRRERSLSANDGLFSQPICRCAGTR